MNISFHYNWPPGNNHVSVSLGMATVQDQECLFRVGIVKGSDKEKVYWQGEEEWIPSEKLSEVQFVVDRGDLIVVDRKNRETDEIEGRCKWDTEEDWPSDASGASSTHVPFDF